MPWNAAFTLRFESIWLLFPVYLQAQHLIPQVPDTLSKANYRTSESTADAKRRFMPILAPMPSGLTAKAQSTRSSQRRLSEPEPLYFAT